MSLPSWPPEISEENLQELTHQAATYALANGLLYLPPITTGNLPSIPSSAIHAPFALFPTPFPRKLFNHAKSLQRIYNVLYARIASDQQFLDDILNAETAVGRVDTFVGELWKIWKEVREEGFAQVGYYFAGILITRLINE
jgi:glutathione synthase